MHVCERAKSHRGSRNDLNVVLSLRHCRVSSSRPSDAADFDNEVAIREHARLLKHPPQPSCALCAAPTSIRIDAADSNEYCGVSPKLIIRIVSGRCRGCNMPQVTAAKLGFCFRQTSFQRAFVYRYIRLIGKVLRSLNRPAAFVFGPLRSCARKQPAQARSCGSFHFSSRLLPRRGALRLSTWASRSGFHCPTVLWSTCLVNFGIVRLGEKTKGSSLLGKGR